MRNKATKRKTRSQTRAEKEPDLKHMRFDESSSSDESNLSEPIPLQPTCPFSDTDTELKPDELSLNFDLFPDVPLRTILSNFTKIGLLRLLTIRNRRWRRLVNDVLHAHQSLVLFIGNEVENGDVRNLQFSNIATDHLSPPSKASLKERPEYLRYEHINQHIFDWLKGTFPQIRHLMIQCRPVHLTTFFLSQLLRFYSPQLVSLSISFVGFRFTPYSILNVIINQMPKLKHLTVHGLCCCYEMPNTDLSFIKQLESLHFSFNIQPQSFGNLTKAIADHAGKNDQMKSITFDVNSFEPNAEEITPLPADVKAKMIKLHLTVTEPVQIDTALDGCTNLKVLSLQRLSNFPIEQMLHPLVRHPQLLHLKFDLNEIDLNAFAMRSLLTPLEVSRFIQPMPWIESMTLLVATTNHSSLCHFPFGEYFPGLKWVRFHFAKYDCQYHDFEDPAARQECNRLLVHPLSKCAKLEKIFSFSFNYEPHPDELNANLYLQNDTTKVHYEWTTAGEWTAL